LQNALQDLARSSGLTSGGVGDFVYVFLSFFVIGSSLAFLGSLLAGYLFQVCHRCHLPFALPLEDTVVKKVVVQLSFLT